MKARYFLFCLLAVIVLLVSCPSDPVKTENVNVKIYLNLGQSKDADASKFMDLTNYVVYYKFINESDNWSNFNTVYEDDGGYYFFINNLANQNSWKLDIRLVDKDQKNSVKPENGVFKAQIDGPIERKDIKNGAVDVTAVLTYTASKEKGTITLELDGFNSELISKLSYSYNGKESDDLHESISENTLTLPDMNYGIYKFTVTEEDETVTSESFLLDASGKTFNLVKDNAKDYYSITYAGSGVVFDKKTAYEGEIVNISYSLEEGYKYKDTVSDVNERFIVKNGITPITSIINESVIIFKMPANDVEITSLTEEITYNIKFMDGDTSVDVIPNVKYTEEITPSPLPNDSENESIFVGWSLTSGGKTIERISKATTTDGEVVTLYANWKAGKEILLNKNYGEDEVYAEPKVVIYGEKYGKIIDPESAGWAREGYDFDGWFTEKVNGIQIKENTVAKRGISNLYAHWTIHPYTISVLDENGNDITNNVIVIVDGNIRSNKVAYIGEEVTLHYSDFKDGYIWSVKSADGTDIDVPGNTFIMPASDVTVTEKELRYYTVTFNANKTEGSTEALTSAEVSSLPEEQSIAAGSELGEYFNPSRTGWDFVGWYDTSVEGNKVTTITSAQTLYAHWSEHNYSIALNKSEGVATVSGDTDTAHYGDSINLSATLNEGYDDLFWMVETDGYDMDGEAEGGSFTMPAHDLTLTAHASKMKFNVTFNGNKTTGSTSVLTNAEPTGIPSADVVEYGSTFASLNAGTPSRTGWDFDGWYNAADGGNKANDTDIITDDINYFAHWSEHNYTVTVNKGENVETVTGGTDTAKYGDTIALSATFVEGYELDSWEVVEGAIVVTDNSFTMPATNVTVTAKAKLKTYTVTFNYSKDHVSDFRVNGESIYNNDSYTFTHSGEGSLELENDIKDGVYFNFWSVTNLDTGETVMQDWDNIDKLSLNLSDYVYNINVLLRTDTP